MLLLQGVAISYHTPGFWGKERFLQRVVRKVAEIHLLLEVPQARRVILEALKPVRLYLNYFLIHFIGILVLGHLKVASGDLCESPPSLVLLLSKLIQNFERLLALVQAKLEIGMPEYLK